MQAFPPVAPPGRQSMRRFFTFWMTSLLCTVWGLAVFISPDALGSTPITGLHQVLGENRYVTGAFLLLSGACGIGALALNRRCVLGLGLMSFQQYTLLMCAGASVLAIATGTYGDGVVRSPWFILTDQSPMILATWSYTAGLVWYFGGGPWVVGGAPSITGRSPSLP